MKRKQRPRKSFPSTKCERCNPAEARSSLPVSSPVLLIHIAQQDEILSNRVHKVQPHPVALFKIDLCNKHRVNKIINMEIYILLIDFNCAPGITLLT